MKVYNHSIDLGEYPSDMKLARVIALFKKGDHSEPENYRPISLLLCFNKIFERLFCIRLNNFIEKYKIYVEFQFGFRAGHSTILALTEITDSIKCIMDNRNYVLDSLLILARLLTLSTMKYFYINFHIMELEVMQINSLDHILLAVNNSLLSTMLGQLAEAYHVECPRVLSWVQSYFLFT